MSNEIGQEKNRLKSLVDSGIKYKDVNGKRRRLCFVDTCQKQSHRKGLCARHLTENINQQKSQKSTTDSHQLFTQSVTEEFSTTSNNRNDLIVPTEDGIEQNTFLSYGELLYNKNICLSNGIFHFRNILDNVGRITTLDCIPKQTTSLENQKASTNQMISSKSSITIIPSGKYIIGFLYRCTIISYICDMYTAKRLIIFKVHLLMRQLKLLTTKTKR
jgi:hypothetical protein